MRVIRIIYVVYVMLRYGKRNPLGKEGAIFSYVVVMEKLNFLL